MLMNCYSSHCLFSLAFMEFCLDFIWSSNYFESKEYQSLLHAVLRALAQRHHCNYWRLIFWGSCFSIHGLWHSMNARFFKSLLPGFFIDLTVFFFVCLDLIRTQSKAFLPAIPIWCFCDRSIPWGVKHDLLSMPILWMSDLVVIDKADDKWSGFRLYAPFAIRLGPWVQCNKISKADVLILSRSVHISVYSAILKDISIIWSNPWSSLRGLAIRCLSSGLQVGMDCTCLEERLSLSARIV